MHWREAWKYGERAFRYCQLDVGHALCAIRYSAGAFGWTAKVVDEVGADTLATLMGLDRLQDFSSVEREDADLLIAINAHPRTSPDRSNSAVNPWEPAISQWTGRANLLDPRPVYRWPVIDQVSTATQTCGASAPSATINYPELLQGSETRAADIILGRRSAQRFDRTFTMSADVFYRLLDSLLARPIAPWDVWDFAPRIHPILLVHRWRA